MIVGDHAELLPRLRGEEVTLIPVGAGGALAHVEAHHRLTNPIMGAEQTVAEETAARQHHETCAKRNIVVISRPDGAGFSLLQRHFFNFIPCHPHAALRDKLALELIMQTDSGHRRRKRGQQMQRAG
ncbi:hypothetical protein D3C86_1720890 [compost metagenome]